VMGEREREGIEQVSRFLGRARQLEGRLAREGKDGSAECRSWPIGKGGRAEREERKAYIRQKIQ
jgi:hypothetical protein